jgi:hypothetical protein
VQRIFTVEKNCQGEKTARFPARPAGGTRYHGLPLRLILANTVDFEQQYGGSRTGHWPCLVTCIFPQSLRSAKNLAVLRGGIKYVFIVFSDC